MSKTQVLNLEPKNELTFEGPFTEVVTTTLTLQNPTGKPVFFKVKTTAPRYYCVRPNAGLIKPEAAAKICVMLQPVDNQSNFEQERIRHKFMIQSAFADKSEDAAPDEFWKTVSPSDVMDSKLKVVFKSMTNGASSELGSGGVSDDTFKTPQRPVDRAQQMKEAQRTAQLEEDNRTLTMQIQELRHKLNTMRNNAINMEQNVGFSTIYVALIALAAILLGVIAGKLF